MMKLGIFSRTYENSDLNETYRKMTKEDIYHTQLNLSNAGIPTLPEKIEDTKIEEILTLTDRYKITIDALSGTFNMIDPDVDARVKGCAQFKTQCEIARMLNIPVVTLCTGSKNPESKWKWHDDNLKQSSWEDLMRTTDIIVQYAEDNGITLGVETEASNIINTPERARRYLDCVGSKHLKIIMDGANLFRPEQISNMRNVLKEAFDILGADIVLAHAKDFSFDERMEFVAAGEGMLDFEYYIKLLKKYGYHGAFVMHGLSERQVSFSSRFLQEVIAHESIFT